MNYVETWIKKGDYFRQKKDYKNALSSYFKVIEVDKNNTKALHAIGLVYSDTNKHSEALKYYNQVLQINNKESAAWYMKAKTLEGLNYMQEALDAFDIAISLKPNCEIYWYAKGAAYIKIKRYNEALDVLNESLKVNKKFISAIYGKAIIFYVNKEYYKAINFFEEIIQINPNDYGSWNGLGNCYNKLKRYNESLFAYNKAIEIDPKKSNSWNGKGNILKDIKQYDQALEAYYKAVKIDEKFAAPWNGIGVTCFLQNKHERALEAFNKSISLDRNYSTPLYGKGLVLYDLKCYNEALSCFLRYEYLKGYFKPSQVYQLLKLFKDFQYPLLKKRIILQYKFNETQLINGLASNIENECKEIESILMFLKFNKEYKHNPFNYYMFISIITYYLGDSPTAFSILDYYEDDDYYSKLIWQYYLYKSALAFYHEETPHILNSAIKQAEILLINTQNSKINLYYAGLLFIEINNLENAIACFKNSIDYLPSCYMLYSMVEEEKLKYLELIIEKEKQLQITGDGFLIPIERQYLSINKNKYLSSIIKYAHFKEIEDIIFEIGLAIEKIDQEQMLKKSWEFALIDINNTQVYKLWKIVNNEKEELRKANKQILRTELKLLYDQLKLSISSFDNFLLNRDIESKIAEIIYLKTYTENIIEDLISYLYFSDKIDEQTKILLHYYNTLKCSTHDDKVKDKFFSELIKKTFITSITATIIKFITPDLGNYIPITISASGAAFAETLMNYLKTLRDNTIKDLTYENYKANFLEFMIPKIKNISAK